MMFRSRVGPMWQVCECQQVVDSRLVVQRWRKPSDQKPSVIVRGTSIRPSCA